eukprot:SAG11_NODE_33416_length_277_cov_1.056180_1_plen_77_part_10
MFGGLGVRIGEYDLKYTLHLEARAFISAHELELLWPGHCPWPFTNNGEKLAAVAAGEVIHIMMGLLYRRPRLGILSM